MLRAIFSAFSVLALLPAAALAQVSSTETEPAEALPDVVVTGKADDLLGLTNVFDFVNR